MIHQNADYGGYSSYGGYDGYGMRYGGVVVGFYGAYCNPDGNGRYMHGKWVCGAAGPIHVWPMVLRPFVLYLFIIFLFFFNFDAKNLIFKILILR